MIFFFVYEILYLNFSVYREKAKELWDWMRQLEAEKFELQYTHMKQKYEVRYHTLLTINNLSFTWTDSRKKAKIQTERLMSLLYI